MNKTILNALDTIRDVEDVLQEIHDGDDQLYSLYSSLFDARNDLENYHDEYQWHKVIPGQSFPSSDGRYLCKIEYQNTFVYMVCDWANYDGFVPDFQFPEGTYEIVAFKCIEEFEDS